MCQTLPPVPSAVEVGRSDQHRTGYRIAGASDAVATAVTGGDGRYKLGVATGQLLVGVSHPDYAPQARYADVGAEGAVANFSLVPGAVNEGVVRDDRTRQPVHRGGVATPAGVAERGGEADSESR